jgi:antirestriction protein ArdC
MDLTEVLKNLMDQMTDGDAEWHMPWHGLKRLPRNVSSGKGYSGINKLILWAKSTNCGYASQHWGTFQQWRRIGQPVGRRERGTVLVMPITKRGQAGGEQLLGFRTYHVFNRDQVLNRNEGHPDLFGNLVNVVESETVEHLVRSTNAAIQTGGNAAAYNPIDDRIRIPTPDSFVATRYSTPTQNYYSTLLHELVHWTGHESRENRFGRDTPSVEEYAFEELVAEIGAAFLCSELELEDVPRKDHAQYLNHWLTAIRDKPQALWHAAALAQRAANYLRQIDIEEPESEDSACPWLQPEPRQVDILAPMVL